ncbi:MAG: 4Fe-4S binding protein [Anaerolineales bacterium]|nr:4Fe-4S binding protein [Anaerolineales bacterium]
MFGMGILKGFCITLGHLLESYWEDVRGWGWRYFTPGGIAVRRSKEARGIFTVQYPEERLPLPEAFRMLPFLIYDENGGGRTMRCTACGTCARVCPAQCIWIVRARDPETGKPLPAPAEFFLDIDRCMNCGYCAEFCPFDAVRMDREYELASTEKAGHRYNLEKLLRPASYHAAVHPAAFAREQAARAGRGTRRTEEA